MEIKIGTCGWSYFPEHGDKLINYIRAKYNVVEVNSSFYRIPRQSTAKRWREKADSINKDFEFTVKAFKGITHLDRFEGKSKEYFEKIKEIAKLLRAKLIVFQTPKSFSPSQENIERLRKFFSSIDRESFILGLEVRWKEQWKDEIVEELFKELELIHVVDPLRREPLTEGIDYYRLHGFGKRLYDYRFSEEELLSLKRKIEKRKKKSKLFYVLFNNFDMYKDAKRFSSLL